MEKRNIVGSDILNLKYGQEFYETWPHGEFTIWRRDQDGVICVVSSSILYAELGQRVSYQDFESRNWQELSQRFNPVQKIPR